MNLGNIENVVLTPTTKTTLLISKLSHGERFTNTLCIDANMEIQYNKPNPLATGVKSFKVYWYLTESFHVENRHNSDSMHMTFTELKKYFTNRSDIDAKEDYEHPLIKNVCEAIRSNIDMELNTTVDYFFKTPLDFLAQGNWKNRGWGHAFNEYLVGVKIRRCR